MANLPYKITVKIDNVWHTVEGVIDVHDADGPPEFENRANMRPPALPAAGARRTGPPVRPAAGPTWKDDAPDCDHGQMRGHEGVYKSGRNAGQEYRAYFCAAPQSTPDDEKCKPVWL